MVIAVRYLDGRSLIDLEKLTEFGNILFFELGVAIVCISPIVLISRTPLNVGLVQGFIAWIICQILETYDILLFELPFSSFITCVFYFAIFLPFLTNIITGVFFPYQFIPETRQSSQASPRGRRAHSANPLEQETNLSQNMIETLETGEMPLLPQSRPKMKTRAEILLERMKGEDKS